MFLYFLTKPNDSVVLIFFVLVFLGEYMPEVNIEK